MYCFSILERIVGIETFHLAPDPEVAGGQNEIEVTAAEVSVSSNGSLALRLRGHSSIEAAIDRFSILERIVGIETQPAFASQIAYQQFQYPRTDRWH